MKVFAIGIGIIIVVLGGLLATRATPPKRSPSPRPSISVTPTPPPGCYYHEVQCIRAPCYPELVCPSPLGTP